MTTKERWLNALACKPIDRFPFWPKLDASYARAQEEPFRSMPLDEIHAFIGSEPPIGIPTCVSTRSDAVYRYKTQSRVERTNIDTPVGSLTSTRIFDVASQSWHPTEFPIKNRDDLKTYTWVIEHSENQVDPEAVTRAVEAHRNAGDKGATLTAIGKSALMNFVEFLAGVENAHYFLADYESDVSRLFDAHDRSIQSTIDILLEHSPADMLMMVENTSTTLISPTQYARYCANPIAEYTKKVRHSDKAMVLHMCGYLHDLLPQLQSIGAHAFEAFTSPPVGNTPIYDGRSQCSDVCLIGGTNAALWLESSDRIIELLESDLLRLPHCRGIIPSSAGVMPPPARPETIRAVCDWVKNFPVDSIGEVGVN